MLIVHYIIDLKKRKEKTPFSAQSQHRLSPSHLLTGQSGNTGQVLALQKLKRGTTTGGNVAELVLGAVLGRDGGGVTTTDDDDGAVLGGLDDSVQGVLGAAGEGLHLEDTAGAVPQDGLGLGDSLLVELNALLADVQAHVAVGDALGVGGLTGLSIGGELVGDDVVDGEDQLDVVLLGLLDDIADDLGAGLVEEAVADLDALQGLLEGEGHGARDDQAVDLGQQVVDQLDFVGDLGAAEDGQEGARGVLQRLGEVVEFLLHQEAGSLLRHLDADHRAVGAVGSAECVVWVVLVCRFFFFFFL